MLGIDRAGAPGNQRGEPPVHKRRIVVAMEHVGTHAPGNGSEREWQTRVKTWPPPEHVDWHAERGHAASPGARCVKAADRHRHLGVQPPDHLDHKAFSAARNQLQNDLQHAERPHAMALRRGAGMTGVALFDLACADASAAVRERNSL